MGEFEISVKSMMVRSMISEVLLRNLEILSPGQALARALRTPALSATELDNSYGISVVTWD